MNDEIKHIHIPLPDSDEELHSVDHHIYIDALRTRMTELSKNFCSMMLKASSLSKAILDSQKVLHPYINGILSSSYIESVSSAFSQMTEALSEVARQSIPNISEDRKKQLIDSHRRWGEFGWTYILDASLDFYSSCPDNIVDANRKIKPLCTAENIDRLFCDLRAQKLNQKNLGEAIACYQDKRYKSCCLILFSLIDAKLIRAQPKGTSRRNVGSRAVSDLKNQLISEKSGGQENLVLSQLLRLTNLFSCLSVVFKDAHDFKCEPKIVNRNFISHGMSRRDTRQRDCIQLFLLLLNLCICV